MNNLEITKQAVMFNRSRSNLLLVVAFTTINLFLFITGSTISFLFSAIIPRVILMRADALAWSHNNDVLWLGGIVLAFSCVFIYCLCWMMAKRQRVWILIALIFFSIDAVVFTYFLFIGLAAGIFELFVLIEVAFYGWIMYYLITGTIAWSKLRHVTPQQFAQAAQDAGSAAATTEAQNALKNLNPDDEDDKTD